MEKKYKDIIQHYESCYALHGDNHKGMDWPKAEDVDTRYQIMLDIIRVHNKHSGTVSILDFGCGLAHLLDYIQRTNRMGITYRGLDLSQTFIDQAQIKYPEYSFFCLDILENPTLPPSDYIIMNGVFTEKLQMPFEEMWSYFQHMIHSTYQYCQSGIALNVMSKSVDWEREDLFHLPLDLLSDFLCKEITRNFIIRNDYGLYEYTVYIFK